MEQQFGQLKIFVDVLKKDPSILHHPGLTFFREYIESLGGTIPEAKKCPFGEAKAEAKPEKKPSPPPAAEPMETEAEPEPEIPYPEIDNEGVIQPDSGEALPMGDTSKEASEEEIEKAQEERDAAQEAFSNGEFDKALDHFTKAIQLNPGSAMLHAKRANCLLKLKRPVSAIADCTKAIEINPDSAQGYKFRGRAHRLLGNWLDAHKDLATACKLDYDDTANEWLKEVEPNAKKLHAYQNAKERADREKEIRDRKERVRKAQEAHEKAKREEAERGGFDENMDDFPGMGGGMGGGMPPGMDQIFSDPDFQELLKDPSMMAALSEVMQNPAAIGKHMNNPKLMKVFSKLMGGAGGMGGMGGFGGGMNEESHHGHSHAAGEPCGGHAHAETKPAPDVPKKAPEPDLD